MAPAHELREPVDPLTAPLLDVAFPMQLAPVVPAARAVPAEVARGEEPPPFGLVEGPAEVTWPCLRCGHRNVLEATLCTGCGTSFLAPLRDKPALVLPLVGNVHALSRGQRAGVAGVVLAAVLVPLALITYLLTGSPPPSAPATSTGTSVSP